MTRAEKIEAIARLHAPEFFHPLFDETWRDGARETAAKILDLIEPPKKGRKNNKAKDNENL
jgi:hypothetical protein